MGMPKSPVAKSALHDMWIMLREGVDAFIEDEALSRGAVAIGAVGTALLFQLGQFLISLT